jgi:hypothetical protein
LFLFVCCWWWCLRVVRGCERAEWACEDLQKSPHPHAATHATTPTKNNALCAAIASAGSARSRRVTLRRTAGLPPSSTVSPAPEPAAAAAGGGDAMPPPPAARARRPPAAARERASDAGSLARTAVQGKQRSRRLCCNLTMLVVVLLIMSLYSFEGEMGASCSRS